MMLALWFLVADAYWMSKARNVEQCAVDKATEVVKHTLYKDYFHINTEYAGAPISKAQNEYRNICSALEGVGYYWDHSSGMAYWEVILTMPVMYRYR